MSQTQRVYFNLPTSVVRDYNVAQGVTHPSDLTTQIIRDYNIRYVTIENSSPTTPLAVSIADSWEMEPPPPIKFTLAMGEIRHIGINTIGEPMQYIHMFSLLNKKYLGEPYPLRTDANQFVLREGINKWFVSPFRRPSYNAAH
jgi:hypothetical protein